MHFLNQLVSYHLGAMLIVCPRRSLQFAATFTASLAFFAGGTIASWPSPTLPKLAGVSVDQGSWIVSVIGVGGLLAPLIGFLTNLLGRRVMLICAAVPILTSWILIVFHRSVVELMVARLIAGVGMTCIYVVSPIYVGELAEEDIRGMLGGSLDLFFNLGALFCYCAGPSLPVSELAWSCAVVPVIFLLLMLFMPETPYFLLMKKRRLDAELSLMRLRGRAREDIQEELNRMQTEVDFQMKNKSTLCDVVAQRGSRRALTVTIGMFVIQQFGGIMAILSYTQQIFELVPGSSLTSSESAMVVGSIQVIAIVLALGLVDRVGRKPLLITSCAGCSLSLVVMGSYLYWMPGTWTWVPLACLVGFVICFSLGLSPLPVLLLGELFAFNVKGLAVAVSVTSVAISYAIVTKMFEVVVFHDGAYAAFWFFSLVSATGVIFVKFLVPETRGKKFCDILAEMNGN